MTFLKEVSTIPAASMNLFRVSMFLHTLVPVSKRDEIHSEKMISSLSSELAEEVEGFVLILQSKSTMSGFSKVLDSRILAQCSALAKMLRESF